MSASPSAPTTVVQDFNLDVGAGRVRLLPRPVGLRQDDGAAHGRRLRGADLGQDRRRRQGHHPAEAQPAQCRHGVPGLCAVSQPDRRAEHRLRPEGRRHAARPTPTSASPRCSTSSSCRSSATAIPTSSPAASSSASRWPARWRRSRSCCCSTSRCRRSTPRSASRCARKSARSRSGSASPPSSSRMTRKRRCRSPTASS